MPLQTTKYAKCSSNMAITRGAQAPVLCNLNQGIYAGASDPVEDVAYPMTNLLDRERTLAWKVPARASSADDVCVEFDLGEYGTTVGGIGVLGLTSLDESISFGTVLEMNYKTVADGWSGAWRPFLDDSVVPTRDYIYSFSQTDPSEVTDVRFVQFKFISASGTPGWTLGKFFVGEMEDLGVAYGLGSTESSVIPRSRVSTMGGTQFVTEYGRERRIFVMKFNSVLDAVKNQLVSLSKELEPFVLHAPSGEAFECRPTSDTIDANAVFGVVGHSGVDVWSVELSVESLP